MGLFHRGKKPGQNTLNCRKHRQDVLTDAPPAVLSEVEKKAMSSTTFKKDAQSFICVESSHSEILSKA